jgi:hypothetical protein
MTPDARDEDKLRKTYSDLRARLIAERDREEARIAESRGILRRIAKELAAVEREQRQLEGGE